MYVKKKFVSKKRAIRSFPFLMSNVSKSLRSLMTKRATVSKSLRLLTNNERFVYFFIFPIFPENERFGLSARSRLPGYQECRPTCIE